MVTGQHRALEAIGVHQEAGARVHLVLAVKVGVHLGVWCQELHDDYMILRNIVTIL